MTPVTYTRIMENLFKEILGLADEKREEYANEADALYNFKYAALRNNKDPKEVLIEWMDKHTNSLDMHFNGLVDLPKDKLKEKIKDVIIYLVLLLSLEEEK